VGWGVGGWGVLLGQGQGPVSHGLQVFPIVEVGGAQVDAVGGLGGLQGLLPAARRLVEAVEEVEALAAPVQLLRILLPRGMKTMMKMRVRMLG